jgi:hypothetical protein
MAGVQLTETGDRTSRLLRAIVTQCQFSIFCRKRCLQLLDRPPPIRIRLGFAIYLHFSRRIHSLLLGPEADKIDITGRYVLWCIGN